MHRRSFLSTGLATLAAPSLAAEVPTPARQYYELRKYSMTMSPQMAALTDAYMADALIPAVNRMGIAPVGAFKLDIGADTPALYVLLPAGTADALVDLEANLALDPHYLEVAVPFLHASTEQPPFVRVDTSLLQAFEGVPTLHRPTAGRHAKRIFQLRTYESPTWAAHLRKIEMFHSGEFDFFANAGCEAIFYAQNLIGGRRPSLTYMLTFADLTALRAGWDAFSATPAWIKLKADPRFSGQTLVSNISSLVMNPTIYSQI